MMETMKLTVPKDWNELDDQQLYYVYNLIGDNMSSAQMKTYCLFRFGQIKMLCRYGNGYLVRIGRNKQEFLVNATVITEAIQALNYLDNVPEKPVRIGKIKGHQALDPYLKGADLQTYLYVENLYQGFLATESLDLLLQMGRLLYNSEGMTMSQAERLNVFYWWTALKLALARQFPHLFAPQGDNGNLLQEKPLQQRLQDAMNNQIRALTKGDITKEEEVLSMSLWRALTELDNLAREAEELNRKFNHNG